MFTPQRKTPWTPKNDHRPNSFHPQTASERNKGKTVAFFDSSSSPMPPPPMSSLGAATIGVNGANSEDWRRFKEVGLLDESSLERKDHQALVDRISRLEKELFDYQYNMGLLLIEKKDLVSKTEELGQEVSEAQEILKRERAAHLIAVSEAEKRGDNLKKALDVERRSINDLERALRDMHEEFGKAKATSETSMTDINARMEELQKQKLHVEERSCSVDAKLAELDRKNSEIDRKLQDLEVREKTLQREQISLNQERESYDSYFRKQKNDLLEWEKKLQEGEQRLCDSRRILNEREEKLHEIDISSKIKESNIEELQKKIDMANATLKKVENDVKNQLADLDMKEKEAEAMICKLEERQKQLQEEEERLNARESVELQELLSEHKARLDAKMHEFESDMKQKRTALEEELKSRKESVDQKETEINHFELKLGKREQALEKKSERVKEKEKDLELKNKALKEQEKCLKVEEKRVEADKKQVNAEKENLESLRLDIEVLRNSVREQELHIEEERIKLEDAEKERLEYLRLQSNLKKEIDNVRRQSELIEKEAVDLKLEREKFEKDWEALDEKRAIVDSDLKNLAEKTKNFEKFRKSEEERLERVRAENEERVRLESENIRLQKESFEAAMEHERLMVAEEAKKKHELLCQDFEQQKEDLYIDMQKRREEWEKLTEAKERALEEMRLREMNNIKNLKEDAENKREEMETERRYLEKEREELNLNKKQLEETGIEISKDIEALDNLSKKLKKQRKQLVSEREHFGVLIEKIKCCRNCGESVQAFLRTDYQLPHEGSSHVPMLSRDNDSTKDEFASFKDLNKASTLSGAVYRDPPQSSGKMSVLRKCASIFYKSPEKGIKHTDDPVMKESLHSDALLQAKEHVSGQTFAADEVNVRKQPAAVNELGPAFEFVNDGTKISQSHVREDNIENSLTLDEFNIDSEVECIKEAEKFDLKNGKRKPGRKRRSGVQRTHSVKAVVEDAKAILRDGSVAKLEEQPNDSAGAVVNSQEKTLHTDMTHATSSARKRSRSQASKMTQSEQDVDYSEGNADSVTTGGRRKRRQTISSALPTPGQKRYNLRRHTVVSSGKLEKDDEATHKDTRQAIRNPDETPSQSLDVAVETDRKLHMVQVSTTRSVEFSSDMCNATANVAEDRLIEDNGTSEHEEDNRSMVNENEDGDDYGMDDDVDEDDDDHPGQASVGKKLWNFFTS